MSAHTPGPWSIGDSNWPTTQVAVCGTPVEFRRHATVARLVTPDRLGTGQAFDELYANARLCVAAPALLAAAVSMQALLERMKREVSVPWSECEPVYAALDAAVAKATIFN